jgi:hypothetical protein
MVFEAVAAVLLGGLVLWMVLEPLYGRRAAAPAFEEPEDPEETRRGIALIALKEIDFDRATGKLSDADYEYLKRKYTQEALEALREETSKEDQGAAGPAPAPARAPDPGALHCPRCGPRPEADARFCSTCGGPLLTPSRCQECHAPLEAGSRFCSACGNRVAA